MKTLFKYILLTSFRDKLYWGLLIIIALIFGLSKMVGFSALTEENQMQLVYFAFLSRIVLVVGSILFICFYINKEFENKEIDFILSKSISRNSFILSHWIGFNLVTLILLIPIFLILIIFNKVVLLGLLWWITTIVFEIMIVSTFAIVVSLVLKSSVLSVLASISFYFISRMMGFFVYSISIPQNISEISSFQSFNEFLLKIISTIFPRLDLFGKTEWLLYGINNTKDIYIIILQSLIYIPLMLFISFYDFNRKQF